MRNKTSAIPLQTVLTGLPVAVASLYFLGICFYQGFTRIMGVEETLFPISVDRTLFNGFFALLDLSIPQIGYFLLAAEIIALVAMTTVFLSSSIRVRSAVGAWLICHSHDKKTAAPLEAPSQVTTFANFSARMFVYAAVIFFTFLGILLSGIVADKSGQATANNFLRKIEDRRQPSVDLFLVGQNQPIVAYPILCSATHCAFLINKKSVTYRHELIEKTIAHSIAVNTDLAR